MEINYQNRQNLLSKDYLHNWAVSAGIVTPLSSYIALVNQAQQDRLDKLSGDGSRYTREDRFTVTQPRVSAPVVPSFGGDFGSSGSIGILNSAPHTKFAEYIN